MSLTENTALFLQSIESDAHSFADTLAFIDRWFHYSPSAFDFHELHSTADQNQGSCKILALAQLLKLSPQQALLCFGEHYRQLNMSEETTHLNLRKLAQQGLTEIHFERFPLTQK